MSPARPDLDPSEQEEEEEMEVSSSEEEEDEEESEEPSSSGTPPPRVLPSRATRGLRMVSQSADEEPGRVLHAPRMGWGGTIGRRGAGVPPRLPRTHRAHQPLSLFLLQAAAAEADSGDEEFWGQDFFAEDEAADVEYSASSEAVDVVDSDFDETEEEEEEEGEGGEEEGDGDGRGGGARRKKPLRPPGARRPASGGGGATSSRPPRPPAPPLTAEAKAAAAAARAAAAAEAAARVEAPSLRASTRDRAADAAAQREAAAAAAAAAARARAAAAAAGGALPGAPPPLRRLTQAEVLAEAARTEVENLQDLGRLLEREEAVKARAHAGRRGVTGPRLRTRSRVVNGVEQVCV